ncbi:hypothetical protein ACFWM7_01610 [Streptomyces sp. NPDC058375]|uniref:hypothetical protein n=1 Tax=Streptomyces sp. NPDC058375 TaxID=3346467 RepID=UPI0036534018
MKAVMCPHCRTSMAASNGRETCLTCPRYALPGDTADDVERHETERIQALALLDVALADHDATRTRDRKITDEMEARMGQTIQTRGCSKCGGTMYRTVDTDENGNPTNMSQFICNGCGNME